MNHTDIAVAELNIGIDHPYDGADRFFRMFPSRGAADFSVAVSEEDVEKERDYAAKEFGGNTGSFSLARLERSAVHRKIAERLPSYDALVFHGSAVAAEGKAYLFTAKSGVGKTTHTRLWLKHIPGSFVVNGDKPILRRFADGWKVCGTPWMGKESMGCDQIVPLAAICLLSRGTENRIREIPFAKAFPTLLEQSYRAADRQAFVRTLHLLQSMEGQVRVYELTCNTDGEAAQIAYRGMCR